MDFDWIRAVETLGICTTLVIFFVWQSWIREKRLALRIDALEQFAETTILSLVKKTTIAIRNSTHALKETSKACNDLRDSMKELTVELRARPCQLHEEQIKEDCISIDPGR